MDEWLMIKQSKRTTVRVQCAGVHVACGSWKKKGRISPFPHRSANFVSPLWLVAE